MSEKEKSTDKIQMPGAEPAQDNPVTAKPTSRVAIDQFLEQVKTLKPEARSEGMGRLIFAMDATMSRQPTWDMAMALQVDMFNAVATIGGLEVQLVYFRGLNECRASKWVQEPGRLVHLMTKVTCEGGHTQIGRVLTHSFCESETQKISALVYVGDCMEEALDDLCHIAGKLTLKGIPVFLFQEGYDPQAERAFKEIARLTRGAYCRFDAGAADQLRDLLAAVAVYAAGGQKALENLSRGKGEGANKAQFLLEQLK